MPGPRIKVSIPDWCDWQSYPSLQHRDRVSVSIPDWCDWQLRNIHRSTGSSIVSIPDWCDWQTFDDSKKLANSQYINFCKNSVFFLKSCRTPKVNFLQEFDNMGYLPYFQYVKERSSYKLTAVGHDFSSFSLRSTTN